MQRVIQTTLYFDPNEVQKKARRKSARENPGVTFLCFPEEKPVVFREIGFAEHTGDFFRRGSQPFWAERTRSSYRGEEKVSKGRLFLDAAVRSVAYQAPKTFFDDVSVANPELVEELLNSNIVIEESPPKWEKLIDLLNKTPEVVVGTYVGMEVARGRPWLMIFSVAGAIIVIGPAISVSRALQKGLSKRVRDYFKIRHGRIVGNEGEEAQEIE
jgi:hypothetical protein